MIVIPMVGLSSRFFTRGYKVPKYQLPLKNGTVFSFVLRSFEQYFGDEHFVFLCRTDFGAEEFVTRGCEDVGIARFDVVKFPFDTCGQADTVYQGLRDYSPDEELYIFNIDTFRPGFRKASPESAGDGYLEVFSGPGEAWSFVEPGSSSRVLRTTEKERISDLCSDGLYHFRRKGDFDLAFQAAVQAGKTVKGEYYVAPLYNELIARGRNIRFLEVSAGDVVFCGTPDEYEALRDNRVPWPFGERGTRPQPEA